MKDAPEGMRPIGARLLKSAIDTLRPILTDAKVLDLFAGEGRFGFECLKEDAFSVTFVEITKKMVLELEKTAASNRYKNKQKSILQCDAFKYLDLETKRFDLVFMDPPFSDWNPQWQQKIFEAAKKVLAPEAILLVKCPSQMLAFPKSEELDPLKETVIGESKLLYYKYGKDEPNKS